jgi:hypothetical protein
MSNATPIRTTLKVVGERSEAARELVFDAQSIIDVAAAACLAEGDVSPYSTRRALLAVSKMLDKAAAQMAADQICEEAQP